jgi:AhpD family alkylhydroperoxidase
MQLDEQTMRLIAVGTSVSANCQSCLQANIAKALENGSDEQEIAEAIWVGKMVRRGAASKSEAVHLDLPHRHQRRAGPAAQPKIPGNWERFFRRGADCEW